MLSISKSTSSFFPNDFNTCQLLGRIFLKKHPEKKDERNFSRTQKTRGFKNMKQGCRFVPYTFSETIRHRWYEAGSKDWLPGFGGLIQGKIYF